MTIAEKGMGFRRLPIGPVFDHCQLNFKQCSFTHTARVLPSLTSIICQVSMAFPLCCFPPRLSSQGRVDDPGTFLLVPPGSARDTVMRDMAHKPERENTEWHEPKPKVNWNSNRSLAPLPLMGNSSRLILVLWSRMFRAGSAREAESSGRLSVIRWEIRSQRRIRVNVLFLACWRYQHNVFWTAGPSEWNVPTATRFAKLRRAMACFAILPTIDAKRALLK